MSTVNLAVLRMLTEPIAPAVFEAQANSGAVSTQTAATPVLGQVTRVTATAPSGGTANSSLMLKSLVSGEAAGGPVFVVNDTAVAIKVYPAVGETLNGVANAALTINAGLTGIFVPVYNFEGTADWRAVAIP